MAKTVSQLSKAELLEQIIQKGLDKDRDVTSLKRRDMIEILESHEKSVEGAVEETEPKIDVIGVEEDIVDNNNSKGTCSAGPDIHSPEWTPYVMSLLRDDEKEGQSPKCDGLRRVFELVIGPILESTVDVKQVPVKENDFISTVVVTIAYLNNRNNLGYKHIVSDGADVFSGNTKFPFFKYPTATAATIAEGRCLRKIMRLNVILREEIKDAPTLEESQNTQEISDEQKGSTDNQRNMIKRLAERNKINFTTMIKDKFDTTIDLLNHKEAQEIFHKLNNYQRGEEVVPEEYKIK